MKIIAAYTQILVTEDEMVENFKECDKSVQIKSTYLVTLMQKWGKMEMGRNIWESILLGERKERGQRLIGYADGLCLCKTFLNQNQNKIKTA